jgi:hypothetical protein
LPRSFILYLAKSISCEAPYYAVISNLLSLHPYSVQVFSSAPCSQTPSVRVPPLCQRQSFATRQNHRHNYSFVYSNFYVFRQQTKRQKVLNRMVTSVIRIQCYFNFLLNQIEFVTFVPKYFNISIVSPHPTPTHCDSSALISLPSFFVKTQLNQLSVIRDVPTFLLFVLYQLTDSVFYLQAVGLSVCCISQFIWPSFPNSASIIVRPSGLCCSL